MSTAARIAERMDEQISLPLDRLTRAALAVLTANGTDAAQAVRTAVIDAAERYPEPTSSNTAERGTQGSLEDQIAASVAAAPPLTDYQAYVVKAAFVERRSSWLSESQWRAQQQHALGEPQER